MPWVANQPRFVLIELYNGPDMVLRGMYSLAKALDYLVSSIFLYFFLLEQRVIVQISEYMANL